MTQTTVQREFGLTRVIAAPREVVFRAWTEAAHLSWFYSGLNAAQEPVELDLRVGGIWKQRMVISEDTSYYTGGIYREIVPVERLVFTWGALEGWPKIDPERPEDDLVATVTLNGIADKTEMVFHLALPAHLSDDGVRQWLNLGIREGWSETLDRLVSRYAAGAHAR